jgi:hypothetical protein
VIVSQDMESVRQAALELMVESLKEEDTGRQLGSLLQQESEVAPETLIKIVPARKLASGFYEFAAYLMWLRGMNEADVELTIFADEAEGLLALRAARQDFEQSHPACPRCSVRQYSSTPIVCRKCGMNFKKGR